MHSVIPHHHHFDSIYSHQNDKLNQSIETSSNPDNENSHCHAFNDFTFDDIVPNNSILVIKILDNLFSKITTGTYTNEIQYKNEYIHFKECIKIESPILFNFSLRGPPINS